MQLYFLRHGIAVDHGAPGYEVNDDGRPLTDKGRRLTRAVAKGVATLVRADIILTSPLPRARQTADLVAPILHVDVIETELLGLAFNRDCLAEALRLNQTRAPDQRFERIILVGHEPSFTLTIAALTGPGTRLRLKKTGLARVDVDENLDGGVLRWLLTPAQLRRIRRA